MSQTVCMLDFLPQRKWMQMVRHLSSSSCAAHCSGALQIHHILTLQGMTYHCFLKSPAGVPSYEIWGKTACMQTPIQPVFQCQSLLRDRCSACKHPPASLSTFYWRFPHAARWIREASCSQIQHEKIQVNFLYSQLEAQGCNIAQRSIYNICVCVSPLLLCKE